ncbi:MAG: bifunctional hydroxymethylpyrimidine kinase/phosphomethylpyrimidine kinase [FCB group bacterium]|nr:bifunctional hydroxymethylpyrimidine kinase/phosphomethylpyrimidine kinase [FCB group bacterium]MBL7028619.1 bifunctional hydroxymethylpyrimidine kinase/phosphomethylpyrimidine kinase [Candidatus Neomarinimicrobiota bacterium]MBL7121807.1 bifunctional hydroxymethylpyrimidine kinase/phosphomethylpyrimidine kinase [Candidatus Neomarinimicrobiota bacterium]
MSLIIVGSLALDTIEAPTGSVAEVPGGSSSYCSIAASYFTHPNIVGVVGNDFPDSVVTLFKDHQINLEGMTVEEGKTFRWGGRYADNFDDRTTLFTELNVFETFNPILPAVYKNAAYVLLANIHPVLQHHVLDQLEVESFVVLDTMNLWIDTALDDLLTLIKRVNMLVINDEEARMLTQERNYKKAASKLHAMGPEWVVIKKGQHGALLFHDDQIFSVPGLVLDEVKDPTGAGDTFVGALIGYLDQSKDHSFDNMKLAVVFGSVLASFCVQDFSVDGITYLEESDLEARYDEFVIISQF